MAETVVATAWADKGSPCPSPSGADAGILPLRPPAGGRPVTLHQGGPAAPGDLFEITYCDERFRFAEGDWGRFGRDDEVCEITVWNEIRDLSLSRVAGEIWCTDGQLWVRNLSASHELVVRGGGRPQWLGRREPGTRGAACSIPGGGAAIVAPSTGDWAIAATSLASEDRPAPARPADRATTTADRATTTADLSSTVRVDPVPDRYRAVASALCAPLLTDGDAPATYDDVAQRLGISRRQARRYIEQLCDHYRGSLPEKVLPPPADGAPAYLPLARLLVARGLVQEG